MVSWQRKMEAMNDENLLIAKIGPPDHKEIMEMCKSCIHKSYCMAAFKKDHWCKNHIYVQTL